MMERRKSTKKWRKRGKFSVENRKRELCWKPENDINFLNGKPENLKIYAENRKLLLKTAAGLKTGKHPKDNEKWRKPVKQGK